MASPQAMRRNPIIIGSRYPDLRSAATAIPENAIIPIARVDSRVPAARG